MGRDGRRRTLMRRQGDSSQGRKGRAHHLTDGPPGQDGIRLGHSHTVLIHEEATNRLGCTQVVQPVRFAVAHGLRNDGRNLVAQPHQGAAQGHDKSVVHPVVGDKGQLPKGAPKPRPHRGAHGRRGPQLGRSVQ